MQDRPSSDKQSDTAHWDELLKNELPQLSEDETKQILDAVRNRYALMLSPHKKKDEALMLILANHLMHRIIQEIKNNNNENIEKEIKNNNNENIENEIKNNNNENIEKGKLTQLLDSKIKEIESLDELYKKLDPHFSDKIVYDANNPQSSDPTDKVKETIDSAFDYGDNTTNFFDYGTTLISTLTKEAGTALSNSNALSNSIALGGNIVNVVASSLNVIIFPVLLLRAYLRGDPIQLGREDYARLGRSLVTLGLAIAALVAAPAIAVPIMVASAAFTAGAAIFGLGNFLWSKRKLNAVIERNETRIEKLENEISQLKTKQETQKANLTEALKNPEKTHAEISLLKNQLAETNKTHIMRLKEQKSTESRLKGLQRTRQRMGNLRQILPRSLGLVVACTIVTGAVLLLIPPLIPVGTALIIGGLAVGSTVIAGTIASQVIMNRRENKRIAAEDQLSAQTALEAKSRSRFIHETTATFAQKLNISHQALTNPNPINTISAHLNSILVEIKNTKTCEQGNRKLVDFFVHYCETHENDQQSSAHHLSFFNALPDNTGKNALDQLRVLVNDDRGVSLTHEQLKKMHAFDTKSKFFEAQSIKVPEAIAMKEQAAKLSEKPGMEPKPEDRRKPTGPR